MDDSIDSGNFSVRGYLPLTQKDSGIHMHCGIYMQGIYMYSYAFLLCVRQAWMTQLILAISL